MIVMYEKYKIHLEQSGAITLTLIMIDKGSTVYGFLRSVEKTDQVVHIGKS